MRRLILRPGAIGDVIVSLPALESLRTSYLEVWTSAATAPLIRFADRVRALSATGLDLLELGLAPAELIDELRGFDSIVSWYGSSRVDFRAAVEELSLPVTFFSALPPDGCGLHATDFYLEQVRELATCEPSPVPRINCNVARERFAVMHPFSGSARKNWPIEKFIRMAAGISRIMPVQWCAGRDDPPLPGAVQIGDLYDLACWLARASLYIGNDSGITHLAAAVGTPVLAIFRSSDPAVWAPRGTVRFCIAKPKN